MSGAVLNRQERQLILIFLVAAGGRRTTEHAQGGYPPSDLTFRHLTTADGLSQDHVVAILQDHRGFMWLLPAKA
jgi:hypothetical protein